MYIAVDDTDSREGMCTTFLATELIKEFQEYRLVEYPRLVRLNPNVPWKTRGNGAIVLNFGEGIEKEELVGHIGMDIHTYREKRSTKDNSFQKILERTKNLVEKWAELESGNTNPGLIISDKKTPENLYNKAVKDIIQIDEVINILEEMDISFSCFGNGRGIIGAASALAWCPNDYTYEMITYRKRTMWGRERNIEDLQVKKLDKTIESSFDSYDHEEETSVVDPNSPCPVLYGVRGEYPKEIRKALDIIDSEKPDRWVTFLTNQGTDDHIQKAQINEIRPWISVRLKGTVSKEPYSIKGGHVFFEISDGRGNALTAAAYEPTKGFRKIVNRLIEGDIIELYGGIRGDPVTINIEKMKILHLENRIVKKGNPLCPECSKRMSSVGKDAGFRCKKCSTKASEDDIEVEEIERKLNKGWYETPVSARRHLSKPLKRIMKI